MASKPEHNPDSFDAIAATIWRLLQTGTESRHHGFHLATLATIDQYGHPTARLVVLRRVDATYQTMYCHTDARSPKVQEIGSNPRVAWVFYDPDERIQIRAAGRAVILDPAVDDVARAAWEHTSLASRRCYLAPNAPSDAAREPSPNLPAHCIDRDPTAAESEAGRVNFRVIQTRINTFDYLHLAHDGHCRATITYDHDNGINIYGWVEP